MISDTGTRVLLATMRQDRPTVRSVASEAGCAISTAYVALRKLEARGLVTWEYGKQGTLRATCEVVADLGKCGPNRTGVRPENGTLREAPALKNECPPRRADTRPGSVAETPRRSRR